MKTSFLCLLLLSLPFSVFADLPVYKDSSAPIEKRIDDLISKMTLDEKFRQLACVDNINDFNKDPLAGGVIRNFFKYDQPAKAAKGYNRMQQIAVEKHRLGIPVLMHDEGIDGLMSAGCTYNPVAIAQAATWEPKIVAETASNTTDEAKSRGVYHILSPVLNICRDARWGRICETYGEDPYLVTQMSLAFCNSVESKNVVTTLKHFISNVSEGGRDSYPSYDSEWLLRSVYFVPFEQCLKKTSARSIMMAYNSLNGVPCSENSWLINDVLRNEWGFKGMVVSDYGSVLKMKAYHHTALDNAQTAAAAINAGLDVELPSNAIFGDGLPEAYKQGLISEKEIDRAVKKLLYCKFSCGLFDAKPLNEKEAAEICNNEKHRELALETARKSIVLLKNSDVLPVGKEVKTIAVVGPGAREMYQDNYTPFDMKYTTIAEGIKEEFAGKAKVLIADEPKYVVIAPQYFSHNVDASRKPGLIAKYRPEFKLDLKPEIERVDSLIDFDWSKDCPSENLRDKNWSVEWKGKISMPETKIMRINTNSLNETKLLINGLYVNTTDGRPSYNQVCYWKFEANKEYDFQLFFVAHRGHGKIKMEWTDAADEVKQAVAVAKKSQLVVVAANIQEGEGMDRSNLNLPGMQEQMIQQIADTGINTVVVLTNGGAVTMENWFEKADAILTAWRPGEQGGKAVAEVLAGKYNPGGKLPMTWPQDVSQLPLYYNHLPSGRPNQYVDRTFQPQFAFGYGMSYTKFEYSDLKLAQTEISRGLTTTVSVAVANTGKTAGDEVVQLYIRDIVSSVATPVMQLKGFKRISLEAGQKQVVTFDIGPEQLSLLNKDLKTVVEPGQFEIMLGSSSADIRQKAILTVTKD